MQILRTTGGSDKTVKSVKYVDAALTRSECPPFMSPKRDDYNKFDSEME